MNRNTQRSVFALVAFVMLVGLGCSTTPEEPASSRTTQDARGDSDRFFQKLEQEEQKK